LDTGISEKDIIWSSAPVSGSAVKRVSWSKGMYHYRGALVAGSCPYFDLDPPKYAVAQVVGYLKGKRAIHIARAYLGRRKNFIGEHFWARGYYVSTVGKDGVATRNYIKEQEKEDHRLDQLELFHEEEKPASEKPSSDGE
jgi:putative transposase